MIVKDIMTKEVISCISSSSILEVMKIMRIENVGFVVVKENKKCIGVITDRDIVLALSNHFKIDDNISSIMKKHIISIDEYSHINDASDLLGNMQVKRLVVTNNEKNVCGVLSIADLARHVLLEDNALEALTEISYDFNPKKDSLIQIETTML